MHVLQFFCGYSIFKDKAKLCHCSVYKSVTFGFFRRLSSDVGEDIYSLFRCEKDEVFVNLYERGQDLLEKRFTLKALTITV